MLSIAVVVGSVEDHDPLLLVDRFGGEMQHRYASLRQLKSSQMNADTPKLAKQTGTMGATGPDQPHRQTKAPHVLHAAADGQ